MNELKLEEAHVLDFVTTSSTGAAADADSTPTVEVFEDATDTAMDTPAVTKRTSKTGNYRFTVTAAAATGYEVGKSYNVVVSATIGGIATKERLYNFKVRARARDDLAFPVTSGRGLAVDANNRIDVGAWLGTAVTLSSGLPDVNMKTITDGILSAAKLAAGFFDGVWTVASRVLTAGTNIVLAKGTGLTGLNDLDAAGVRGAVGMAAPNLDTQLATIAGYIDTEIATIQTAVNAIKLRTDNLPADPADASDIAAAFSTVNAAIAALNNLSSTQAQSAATAALAAYNTAKVSDVPTAAQNADTLLGRNIAGGSNGGRTVTSALRKLRNRVAIALGVMTVYQEDDVTADHTETVATNPGDPITSTDPTT